MKKDPETGKEPKLSYSGRTPERRVISSTPAAAIRRVRAHPGRESEADPSGWRNMLIEGDNLSVLKRLVEMKTGGLLKNPAGPDGPRLVYIDPPFSTNLSFRTRCRRKAYEDKLLGADFIEFLRQRLILIRELLADDGSVYVHLDWKKAHYIKMVMDEVFGPENFLNDIIWSYGGRGAKAISRQFSRNHDIILYYRKSGSGNAHIFNQQYTRRLVRKGTGGFRQDAEGRWFKTAPRGDYTDASIAELEKEGRVYRTRNGNIRIKYFVGEEGDFIVERRLVGDVWDDIPDAMHLSASEKTGYPTQKPELLLARILCSSTNEGDLVLDAFSGAGTTLSVAEKLGRRWIGIDSGKVAIKTAEERILNISLTKDLSNPGRKYSGQAAGFDVFKASRG